MRVQVTGGMVTVLLSFPCSGNVQNSASLATLAWTTTAGVLVQLLLEFRYVSRADDQIARTDLELSQKLSYLKLN